MAKSVRRSRLRARGSASTSAHHASPVGSCGCDHDRCSTVSRACSMAATSLATSGRTASSRTKFGGMAVPAAQLDLGRAFQEELSCPFDERRQIFVCEDGALVPEQISFKFHFRESRRRGRRHRREPYSNPIRAEIRLPPPCEGRHARSCAPPSIGRPPYRRARRVSRFPHWTSSSILLGVTANHCLGAATVLFSMRRSRMSHSRSCFGSCRALSSG